MVVTNVRLITIYFSSLLIEWLHGIPDTPLNTGYDLTMRSVPALIDIHTRQFVMFVCQSHYQPIWIFGF